MDVHAKQRFQFAVVAIGTIALQTVLMGAPANARTLVKSEEVQQVTAKNVMIEMPERDEFRLSRLVFPLDDMWYDGISSYYGYRKKPCSACSSNHAGIDFPQAYGSVIRSVFYGVVVEASYQAQNGYTVSIRHDDLGGMVTEYAHMKKGSFKVKVGDRVRPGQPIGQVGATGVATANHLHFGVWIDGHSINPLTWLKSYDVVPFEQAKREAQVQRKTRMEVTGIE